MSKGTKVGSKGEIVTLPLNAKVLLCRYWKGETQFSSVTQFCPTLCNPMDSSTSGLPVHHQPQELAQIHAHRVGDAIQPSHPLLF